MSSELDNFLSTFSGTYYVTPRTVTAPVGISFLRELVRVFEDNRIFEITSSTSFLDQHAYAPLCRF